jgi:hypothetical protein
MRPKYRVVGHYATVKTATMNGPTVVGLLKGALLPPDVEQATIDHLLDVGLILPLPGAVEQIGPGWDAPDPGSNSKEPVTPDTTGSGANTSDDDLEKRRAEARAKLPTDGSAPKRTHGQPVWVEYAVREGYDRAQVEAATRDELIELMTR